MAVQTDGKIVVAGRGNNNFAVVRYNSDGSPDTNFGVGGVAITDFGANDEAHALTIQSDGKIVVVGTAQVSGANFSFGLVRYNSDGSIDMTFGSGGKVVTGFTGFAAEALAGTIQNDGKIVAAGYADFLSGRDFGLARFDTGGTLDTSFGTGAEVTTDFFGLFDMAFAIAIQSNGKIIAAGFAVNPNTTNRDFALTRYNSHGSLDTGFGVGGKITTDFGGGFDEAHAVAVQQDGQIVVAGSGNGSFALARYDGFGFDTCMQDGSNGNSLQLDSTTGDYRFTNCNGFTLTGTGTLIKRGALSPCCTILPIAECSLRSTPV